jgi:hypothetical protein
MMFAFLKMLQNIKYLGLSLLFTILILFLYSTLQVLPQGLNNFWFWFTILTPFGWLLYLLYGIFFGITLSFLIWQKDQKFYPARHLSKGGFLGALGSLLGTTAPVCAGCLPWVVLLFPTSFASVIVRYNSLVMVFSIALILFALWFLGGFKKHEHGL